MNRYGCAVLAQDLIPKQFEEHSEWSKEVKYIIYKSTSDSLVIFIIAFVVRVIFLC